MRVEPRQAVAKQMTNREMKEPLFMTTPESAHCKTDKSRDCPETAAADAILSGFPTRSVVMHDRAASPTRRDLLRTAGIYGLGVSSLGPALVESLAAAEGPEIQPWNRFPRMVHEFFVDRVRGLEHRSLQVKNGLNSKADAEAYVRGVQAKIRQCFGPLPERTPLNPRITGVLDRDGYKVENLIFESRPGFLVTANLYLPKNRQRPPAGRRRDLWAFQQRKGGRSISILRARPGAHGLRRAALRSHRARRTHAIHR